MSIDAKITDFIRKHHVMTLATSVDNVPYCSNLFYAWEVSECGFVFTSDLSTRHAKEALRNETVAASIVLETRVVGRVRGLQIVGQMGPIDESSESGQKARKAYLKRFPYAAVADLSLWILCPTFLKLTDNTLGFGKKLIWTENE